MKNLIFPILVLASNNAVVLDGAEPEWKPVVTELLEKEKPGYGGLCGIVVDRATGNTFVQLSDLGLYRSSDQGENWERMTGESIKGRTESPGCLSIDPTGESGTILMALVYGAPASFSSDQGKTFKHLDGQSNHIDWCAIDWKDRNFILALKHEKKGLMIASNDGGKTFRDVDEGNIAAWVFDDSTAVVMKEGADGKPGTIQRTTDGAKSFTAVGNYEPVGFHSSRALPKYHRESLYWLTREGLITTSDKGATWKKVCEIDRALYGPVFGKEEGHLLVLTEKGIIESKDGGSSWSEPIPAPEELKGLRGLTWMEYDPQHDTFYLMKMSTDLYRLQRK